MRKVQKSRWRVREEVLLRVHLELLRLPLVSGACLPPTGVS